MTNAIQQTTTKWTDLLDEDIYMRLCNCCSRKSDILPLAKAKWAFLKEKQGFDKEDALVYILELLDCNSVYIDISSDEYDDLVAEI